MKYASIDIGTNTALLLIGELKNDSVFWELLDTSTITKLGEGLKETGYLSSEAMDRTIYALDRYMEIIKQKNVERLICVGTSALREAKNSHEFLKKVKDSMGIMVEIISEEKEAYLTYLSVIKDKKLQVDRCIIADIGGGSTEIIKGNKEGFVDFISLPIGSIKLTEMFIKNDPPLLEEMEKAIGYIKGILDTSFDGKGCSFVGTGGTITNVAAILKGMHEYKKDLIHGTKISKDEIERLKQRLASLSIEKRRAIIGLEKGREDIILQGIVFLCEIMDYFDFKDIIVSAYGVRYGIIFEEIGKELEIHR